MPFRPQHSLLHVDVPALRSVDTYSSEDLFGMWSLFSRTANALEQGKRLENLSWRIWTRETLCCDNRLSASSSARHISTSRARSSSLATSISSADSNTFSDVDSSDASSELAPAAQDDADRSVQPARSQKHITPDTLADIVACISQTPDLEPIDSLELAGPAGDENPTGAPIHTSNNTDALDLTPDVSTSTPRAEAPLTSNPPAAMEASTSTVASTAPIESSTSTVASTATTTTAPTDDGQTVGSDSSSCTGISTHSVVRGFAPSSYRSQTNLGTADEAPAAKNSQQSLTSRTKKQAAKFTIGTSSGEDESSFESHMYRSTLSQSLHAGSSDGAAQRKSTSLGSEVALAAARAAENSPVFESDDEDEDVSESAIEDDDEDDDVDDDSSDWEDSEDQSRPSSVNEKELFQRVDSRPNLTSRRSLLTTLMHEPDRARALANAASRSTPAIRRSRGATPNGPSVATTPDAESSSTLAMAAGFTTAPGAEMSHQHATSAARPIILTTSNTHPNQLALSPRTTRRNMLSTELTESLRKNLLWERQHRSHGNPAAAALKRRHTSHDVKNLRQHPEPGPHFGGTGSVSGSAAPFTNEFFDQGLQEYHAKGW